MNGSAYRSETGAAVVSWPNTPDPVDPDAYAASLDPNFMVISARREAHQRSRFGLWLAGFVVAFLVMCLLAGIALAQQLPPMNQRMPCHSATEIAKQLSNRYDESPVAFGLQSNGNLLQVYFSPEKDTWTVVSTTPAGMSCIVADGKRWESLPATPAGSPVSYGEPW